ncbi:radical SAM protein [bacterium]|nr:radical SAM protein [bacterium]
MLDQGSRISSVLKFFFHQLLAVFGKKSFHFPLAIYVYLTFSCNLRCSYCDDGSGHKFPELSKSELSPNQWRYLFNLLVKFSDILMISGGEPMMYPQIQDIIKHAREAGFTFISLNTNGLLITPEIVNSVDSIIISLDSLNKSRSDKIWNSPGATDQVIKTLDRLSGFSKPTLLVNSVILPGNIEDILEVMNYCGRKNITFSAGPALHKTKPVPGLLGNPRYKELLEKMIKAKRNGQKIAASEKYLKGVGNFKRFNCHPLLVWRVYPDGGLVFPCSRIGKTAGNLIKKPNPIGLLKKAAGGYFFETNCGENCPLSCYMDTSYMVQRPLELMKEGFNRFHMFSHFPQSKV